MTFLNYKLFDWHRFHTFVTKKKEKKGFRKRTEDKREIGPNKRSWFGMLARWRI